MSKEDYQLFYYQLLWVEFWSYIAVMPILLVFLPLIVAIVGIIVLSAVAYLTLLDITSARIKQEQEQWGIYERKNVVYERLHAGETD